MEYIIAGAGISLVSFLVGFWQGHKSGAQKVLRILGVRPGYRISGVSFEKMD